MQLINKKNYVAFALYLVNKTFYPAFKLTAELRSGDKCGKVKQPKLLIRKLCGNVARRNALGNSLCNGGFANARFAYKAGVILCAAAQNLDNAVNFSVAPDNRVKAAAACLCCKVFAIKVKKFSFRRFAFLLLCAAFFLLGAFACGFAALLRRRAAENAVEKRQRSRAPHFKAFVIHFLRVHKLFVQGVQLVTGNAHFGHKILYGLYAKFLCALKAKSLIIGFVAFHSGNKNHGHSFFAS